MPRTSDRFIDVLRVLAIVAVVGQHWFVPSLSYKNGILTATNSLAAPGGWAIGWVGQLLPLIFFAGGAAATMSLRHRTTFSWLTDRVRGLVGPVLPLAVVWLALPRLLAIVGAPRQPVQLASDLVGPVLWFFAVYAVLASLTPILVWLFDRWRGREVIVMAATAAGIDILRFTMLDGAVWLGYATMLVVWGAIYHAGIAYAEAGPVRRRTGLALSGAGLGAAVLAIAVGPYALGAVGAPGEPLSIITSPSAVVLALAAGQIGLAFALREPLTRWAAYRPVKAALDRVCARLMTVLLWHLPALLVATGVVVVGFGHATAEPFSTGWRSDAPMWLAILIVTLAGFVRVFGRFELQKPRTTTVGGPRRARIVPPPGAQVSTSAAGVWLTSTRTHRAAGLVQSAQTGRLEP